MSKVNYHNDIITVGTLPYFKFMSKNFDFWSFNLQSFFKLFIQVSENTVFHQFDLNQNFYLKIFLLILLNSDKIFQKKSKIFKKIL